MKLVAYGEMMIFAVLVLLAVAVWLRSRLRVRAARKRSAHVLTDQMVAQIEQTGHLEWEPDEPLDMRRIQEEEKRFWRTAAWDEPETM